MDLQTLPKCIGLYGGLKILKIKFLLVTTKTTKLAKNFTLEIFRLYDDYGVFNNESLHCYRGVSGHYPGYLGPFQGELLHDEQEYHNLKAGLVYT